MGNASFKNALPLLILLIAIASFAVAVGFSTEIGPQRPVESGKPSAPIQMGTAFTEYVPGDVVIKLKTGHSGSAIPDFLSEIDQKYNIESFEKVFKDETEPPLSLYYLIKVPPKTDIKEVVRELNKDRANVEHSEPNYTVRPLKTPNDPNYSEQWAHEIIGSEKAWDVTTGSTDITVAVIDSGVDYTHPDLAANMTEGVDIADGDNDPMDIHGHGTHVSGIIGEVCNNSEGGCGVNWEIKIMPVKIFSDTGSSVGASLGIKYAADKGVRVINMSIGTDQFSNIMNDAVNYAYNRGVLLVAAAGNCDYGCTVKQYPAAYENVIAVGNTTRDDEINPKSSYYAEVEISAPGTEIFSPWKGGGYALASGTSMASPYVAGAAALILSAAPTTPTTTLRTILRNSTDDLGNPGRDIYYGFGRLNIRKAILGEEPPEPPEEEPPEEPPPGATVLKFKIDNWSSFPNNIEVTITATDQSGNEVADFSQQTKTNSSGEGWVSLEGLITNTQYSFYIKSNKHLRKKNADAVTIQSGDNPPNGRLSFGELIVGDVDGDNEVTEEDLNRVASDYSKTVPPAPKVVDMNEDNVVNIFDIVAIGANIGKTGD